MEDLLLGGEAQNSEDEEGEVPHVAAPAAAQPHANGIGNGIPVNAPAGRAARELSPLHRAPARRERSRSPYRRRSPPPPRSMTEARLRRDLAAALEDVDLFCRESRKCSSGLSALCVAARELAATAAEQATQATKLASAARALHLLAATEAEARTASDVRLEELRVELRWLGACGSCGRRIALGDATESLTCGHLAHKGCAGVRGRCGAC